ncbi:uncharacterized protein [Clytia hemisphaerica]|uniref:uncharacterized protein n=1 Tax=Clytia hemisphaerica TaxID=252671 RepID=UPI0034D3A2BE
MASNKSHYPDIEKITDMEYLKKWIPESLLWLLKELIPSELKQVSIGQCISQSAKPRSMLAPIPFGIGVDVDRSFESKWFINHLAKLGFSVSYDEVTNFKRSAASASEGDGPVEGGGPAEGDDTDVAVMMAYHWQEDLKPLLFLSERAKKCWDIGSCQDELNGQKKHLLFIHAWTGCDSTSAICGKAKVSFVNQIKKSEILGEVSEVFTDSQSTKEQIQDASIEAFREIYGGNHDKSLSNLRYNKYLEMLCKGLIQPERLPPTSDAATQHGARVHIQVIRWKELDENVLDPTKWGWQGSDTGLRPIRTIKSVAPPEILKIIKCKCKMSSKNPCGTNLCSCRKNGIPCMPACGNCHGMDCNNKTVKRDHDDEEIPDETIHEATYDTTNETTEENQNETFNDFYDDRNIFDLFD